MWQMTTVLDSAGLDTDVLVILPFQGPVRTAARLIYSIGEWPLNSLVGDTEHNSVLSYRKVNAIYVIYLISIMSFINSFFFCLFFMIRIDSPWLLCIFFLYLASVYWASIMCQALSQGWICKREWGWSSPCSHWGTRTHYYTIIYLNVIVKVLSVYT